MLRTVRAPIRNVPAASAMLRPEIASTCASPACRSTSTVSRLMALSSAVTRAAASAPVSPPIEARILSPTVSRIAAIVFAAAERSEKAVPGSSVATFSDSLGAP